jgi:hypothetical protein
MRDHAFGCACKAHVGRAWRRPEHWSTGELAYLERWYGRRPDEVIAKVLGRSVVALRLRAKRAGILKRNAGLSSRAVARIFGVDESIVSKTWIKRGLLPATKGAFRQGPHHMWLVDDEAVEGFIRQHGQYVDPEKMPDSPYRSLALQHKWYSLPAIERLTGKDQASLSTSLRRGVYRAAKRGTHWYIPAAELPRIAGRVLRVGRWTTLAQVRREREERLARRRNQRKGISLRGVA